MVFQRKSGGKGKQQTPAKSKKSFSEVNDLDDMDMDFNSDSNENQVMKKTPGKTPKGKQAQNDKRVSFQIPGKNTPSNKGTPKGAVVSKKQATPAKVGSLKAFGGMAANSASKRNGKAKKAESDDDDDDSEEDDDDDDDSEGEGADLDMLLAGDSDDDDDEDDDDDDDEDDDEDDEKTSKNKSSKTNVLIPKKTVAKDEEDDEDDDDDDDDEEDDDDDDDDDDEDGVAHFPQNQQNTKQQNQSKNAQKKASTPGQNKNAKQIEKSPIKKEAPSPKQIEKTPNKKEAPSPKKKEMNPIMKNFVELDTQRRIMKNFVELDTQRRRERDARTLYIGNLPKDIVATELKALSNDILAVNLPNHQKNKRSMFAFLEFASEAKTEENFNILKSKKLRGEPLIVDYAGEKSLKRKPTTDAPKDFNLRKLYVADIPTDGMMDQIAQLFPKSVQITLAVRPTFKTATVLFSNENDAAEAIEAAKSAKIGSKPVTVVYSIQKDGSNKKKRKRSNKGKQQNQAGAKKMKLEVDSDDDDDDDDDDEE